MNWKKGLTPLLCILIAQMIFVDNALARKCMYDSVPTDGCYMLDHNMSIYAEDDIRITNGQLTVGPLLDNVVGFGDIFAPPYVTRNFRFEMKLDGQSITPTMHYHMPNDFDRGIQAGDLGIMSTLTLAEKDPVFILLAQLFNSGSKIQKGRLSFSIRGEFGILDSDTSDDPTLHYKRNTAPTFSRYDDMFSASNSHGGVYCTTDIYGAEFEGNDLVVDYEVGVWDDFMFYFICFVGSDEEVSDLSKKYSDTAEIVSKSKRIFRLDLNDLIEHVPYITTEDLKLRRLYDKSILSILTSRWKVPGVFKFYPTYFSSGLDSEFLFPDLETFSAAGPLLALADPLSTKKYIYRFLKVDLTKHGSIDPVTGKDVGAPDIDDPYYLVKLVYDYVRLTGDGRFLLESTGTKSVLQEIEILADGGLSTLEMPEMKDYGACVDFPGCKYEGYDHYLPLANARRVWMYRALAEMLDYIDQDAGQWAAVLREKADHLDEQINEFLWDEDRKCYGAANPDGTIDTVMTSEIFRIIETGVAGRERVEKLLSHLKDGEFTTYYGLRSMPADEEVTVMDDTGVPPPEYSLVYDAPNIATALYHAGFPEKGEDLLYSLTWWGSYFLYYPWTVSGVEIGYDENAPANSLAGTAAAQAIIFGIFGLDVKPDGEISVRPETPADVEWLGVHRFKIRDHELEFMLYKGRCKVTVDGERIPDVPIGERTVIVEGAPYAGRPDPHVNKCYISNQILKETK